MFTNAPVYVDTFIGPPALPNPHVFICGTSGGGKSVALKTLTARNIATTGCGAFFIDVERRIYKFNSNAWWQSNKNYTTEKVQELIHLN